MSYCTNCGKKLEENQVCNCQVEIKQEQMENESFVVENVKQKDKRWMCTLTSIIYPLISIAICFFLATNLPLLLIALMLNIGTALSIYFGGFYLIVIPLPYISLFKWGCVKPEVSLKVKIPLGILSVLLPVLSIILCLI